MQRNVAQRAMQHRDAAGRAGALGIFAIPLRCRFSAVRAELRTLEHHSETAWTGNAGESRTAMPAVRGVPGDGRAATVAVEGLGVHRAAILSELSGACDSKFAAGSV